MPFTLSHVAAVLPALRTDRAGLPRGRGPLLAAGLVAGSLAPDVPFFADTLFPGCHGLGRLTHHPVGVLTVDVLIAAALAGGWTLVREPLAALLPPRAAPLLGAGAPAPPSAGAVRFWASAVAGAATHTAWDTFTHGGRWGVRHLPVLDRRLAGVPLHHWAQYGSSAAGLALLAHRTARALERAPRPAAAPGPAPVARRTATAWLAASALAGAALRHVRDRPDDLSARIASGTFGAGATLALGAAAYAGAVRARRARPA